MRTLLQGVETVLCDLPLSRAVVRMNERAGRQLVVLDETATRVVGILTITDLIRAHAHRRRKDAPAAQSRLHADEVSAGELAAGAPEAVAATPLSELLGLLARSPSGGVIVRTAEARAARRGAARARA